MIKDIIYLVLIVSFVGILSNTYWMVNESPIYYRGIKIWGVVLLLSVLFLFNL